MAIDKEGHGTFDIMLIPADRYNRNPGGAGAALAKERVAVLHYKVCGPIRCRTVRGGQGSGVRRAVRAI